MSLAKISNVPSTEKLSEPACSQPVDTYYSIFLCTVACCYFVLILMELNVYFKSWTVVFLSINVHLLQIQNCIFICYMQSRVFCFPWHVWWNLRTLTLQHWNEIHNLRTNKLIVLQRILLLICVPYAHLHRMYYLYFFNICCFFMRLVTIFCVSILVFFFKSFIKDSLNKCACEKL